MRFRLVDHGYPFKKIMLGKKWVGRVYQHADGTWRGALYKQELSKAATPVVAFQEAVAKHLGHKSAAALKQHNQAVHQVNRARRAEVQDAVNKMRHGDFDTLLDLLTTNKFKNS